MHVRVRFCAEFKTFKFLISWLFTIIIYVQSFQANLCVYVCVCVCVCANVCLCVCARLPVWVGNGGGGGGGAEGVGVGGYRDSRVCVDV